MQVPGSFELPLAARMLIESNPLDAVILIGCVIRGETPHFDFISQAVAHGCMQLGLDTGIPVIFGVLTTNNLDQALDRAGGKHGNKGTEAAVTAIKMASFNRS
jgi:6,7-dimethyl-8-ribityllumazine synthase